MVALRILNFSIYFLIRNNFERITYFAIIFSYLVYKSGSGITSNIIWFDIIVLVAIFDLKIKDDGIIHETRIGWDRSGSIVGGRRKQCTVNICIYNIQKDFLFGNVSPFPSFASSASLHRTSSSSSPSFSHFSRSLALLGLDEYCAVSFFFFFISLLWSIL